MAFCKHCGQKLSDTAKFCAYCGENFNEESSFISENVSKTYFDGDVHKCPRCGEIINSFDALCPTCGHELRNKSTSSATKKLMEKLEKISSQTYVHNVNNENSLFKRITGRDFKSKKQLLEEEEKADIFEEQKEKEIYSLITNFIVPNTKEDILEFLLLANSNRKSKTESSKIREAWKRKTEQLLEKAELTLKNDSDFNKIKENILIEKRNEAKQKKIKTFTVIAIIVSVVLAVSISYIGQIVNSKIEKDNYEANTIEIGISSKDCKGQYYQDIESLFEKKGFQNIEVRNDGKNIFHKAETVKSVTIDGIDEFSATDRFQEDVTIIIFYYE